MKRTMADTFQDICWGIIRGFQDAILGSMKIFKLDSDTSSEQKKDERDEPMTTLARRRAEKQKQTKTTEKKDRYQYLLFHQT